MNLEEFNSLLVSLGDPLTLRAIAFVINLIILLFAEKLLSAISKSRNMKIQARVLRVAALVFLVLHALDLLLVYSLPEYENYFIRIALSIAILFGCLIAFNALSYFSRRKFGEERTVDGEAVYLDSYNSRLVDVVGSVFIVLIAIYLVIVSWDMDSLLQTTGFVGVIFAFLALTNGIWAPDIYYGLVILNSAMLEDGDVVQIEGSPNEYIINRVSFIHTSLLDVRNNHRVIMRNSQIINSRVDNLSKRASAEGLRRELLFNIGYPEVPPKDPNEAGKRDVQGAAGNNFASLRRRIQQMFVQAQEKLQKDSECKVNHNMPFEITLVESSDFALTYGVAYYLESLPSTKVTRTLRQYLIHTPSLVQEAVNEAAVDVGIELATPVLRRIVDKAQPRAQLKQHPGFMRD